MAHHVVMTAIRVLLLSNAITPDRKGGLQRHCRELGTALSRKGADVMIHARKIDSGDPERSIDPDGVEIVRFPTPSVDHPLYAVGYPVAVFRAVHMVARAERSTRVLHSHYPLQALPLALARTPFVHTFHAPVNREVVPEHQDRYALPKAAREPAVKLMRAGERKVMGSAQEVITLSRFMRDEAIALGADAETMTLIPGGIDTDRFSPGPPVSHPWATGDGPLLFTARRLVPRTGVRELVEAFAHVSRAMSGVRLALAGRGPLETDIARRVAELGLKDRVLMLGWVSDQELVGWYRAADLVVMPTQELEGFGLTTAEALACGTPVVGTPAGANPEVLGRLDESLVSRDRSPAALAALITDLLRVPERVADLGERARAAVYPALAWDSVADQHMALFERYSPHA